MVSYGYVKGDLREPYKDALKTALKAVDFGHDSCEAATSDRPSWRPMIRNGATVCEANRKQAAKTKRLAGKNRVQNPPEEIPSFLVRHADANFVQE